MRKLFSIVMLCMAVPFSSNAKSFYYKYLYTVDSNGMKSQNYTCNRMFNESEQTLLVIFSDDYSFVTFGTGELEPYAWRLAYRGEYNGSYYYDRLVVPGLNPGYQSNNPGLTGQAAAQLSSFMIWCGQGASNFSFMRFDPNYMCYVDYIPESPMTILVKADFSILNIVFHKSGNTVVLQRQNSAQQRRGNGIPELIE